MSVFEIGMLVCFGVSWPFAVWRTWRSKTSAGKSLLFLSLVLLGYVSGVGHKLWFHYDAVIYLYVLNGLFVATDLALSVHYRRADRRAARAAA